MSRGVMLAVAAVVGFGLVGLVAWLTLTHSPPEIAPWTAPAEHVAGAPELPSGAAHDVGASRGVPSRPAVDTLPLGTAPPTAVRDPSAEDPAGLVLFGAVVDEAGLAVDAERIGIRTRGPGGAGGWQSFDRPAFAFAGLTPGTWRLTTSVPGFRETQLELVLSADEPLRRVDLQLARAVVLPVRWLTPTGESLASELRRASRGGSWGLSVVATRERPLGDLPPIDHRAYSRYGIGSFSEALDLVLTDRELPQGADGVLQIDGALPAWVSLVQRHVVLASQQVQPGAEEVVFVIGVDELQSVEGSLRLRVVDALTREPVAGTRVGLQTSQGGGSSTDAGEDGTVHYPRVTPGLYQLSITAPDHGPLSRGIEIPAGRELDLGELLIGPATEISGRIVDATGAPHSVSFQLHPLERFDAYYPHSTRRSYRSRDDGTFRATDLARDLYVLRVNREEWVGWGVVDARHGDVENIEVVVHAPTRVTLRPAWPRDAYHDLRVFEAGGTPLSTLTGLRGARDLTLRLAPGDDELVVDVGDPLALSVGSEALELTLRP